MMLGSRRYDFDRVGLGSTNAMVFTASMKEL